MTSTIEMLTEIYPEHIWIDLSPTVQLESKLSAEQLRDRDYNLSRVDLNRLCMVAIKKWLSEVFDLELKSVFPCVLGEKENLEFISKLVNGFALQLGKTRLVFIPSQSIDLTEIEIPQEWVDLPNWSADYYIPIQVDVEGKYLHLWTFISHYDLKNNCEFDPVFRNYEIPDRIETKNLDVLFTACELHALGELTPKRAALDTVPALATTDANKLIEQLQQRRSEFSPRLDFSFSQWGKLLNDDRKWLEYYCTNLNPPSTSDLFVEYINSLRLAGWKLLNDSIYPSVYQPLAIPYLEFHIKLKLDAFKGMPLKSSKDIEAVILQIYQQQNNIPAPQKVTGIEDLVPLLESCKDDKVWWQATEYLWAVKPDLPPSIAVMQKLKAQFAGREIALMIAMVKTPENQLAVLARLYPADGATVLPPGLQLSIQNESGVNFFTNSQGEPIVVKSGKDLKDSSIQLYWNSDLGDRFSVHISLDSTEEIENFTCLNFI
jgi:Protein of unknown function (DUF1822)